MQKILEKVNGFNLHKQENKLITVFIISLNLYAVFLLFGDFRKIKSVFLHFNWMLIPLLLVLTAFNYLFRAIRFHYYLNQIGTHIPFKNAVVIFLAGLSMTLTPGKTGEVVKAYLLKKTYGASVTHVIPALIFERVTDGIAMILLGILGLLIVRQSLLFFVFAMASVVFFLAAIKMRQFFLRMITALEKKLPAVNLLHFFEVFFENSNKLLSGKNLFTGIALGIIAWSFEGTSLAILVHQFIPADIYNTTAISMFIFSFSSIAGFFVFIPGGIGVAEGSITYFLTSLFKLPLPQSVFVTLLFRFITLWFGVGLGLMTLIAYLRRNKDKN